MFEPIFKLPPDSDLAEEEAKFTPEQLADVEFVYTSMLLFSGVLDVMRRREMERLHAEYEREQDAGSEDHAFDWEGSPEIGTPPNVVLWPAASNPVDPPPESAA